jgi:hypothetical protein
VESVTVADAFPSQLIDAEWACSGANGATCTPAGSGDINDTADHPPLSSAMYTVDATVNPLVPPGLLVNTATLVPPVGIPNPDGTNNSATDSGTVFVDPMPFADGFEPGDTSAWSATVP